MAHAMTILAEATTGLKSLSTLTPANKILLSVSRQTPATDYLLAQKLRHLQMQHLAHLFVKYPGLLIVTPTIEEITDVYLCCAGTYYIATRKPEG